MSNINIEYKYRTVSEIINSVKMILDFSVIEFIILGILIMLILSFILYFWPILQILWLGRKKETEKKKKKLSLQQILITKEIETEIENEIKKEQEEKLKAKLN